MNGYVYALINPSLPNMVKVGKTTRSPEERAKELSAATGVPTPFIVGFYIFVSDCDAAEKYTHELLSLNGARLSDSREFFMLSLNEVVTALLDCQSNFQNHNISHDAHSSPGAHQESTEELINKLIESGENSHYGINGSFRDHLSAESLYQSAHKLGDAKATYNLGTLYADEDSDLYDRKKAIKFLFEAHEKNHEQLSCLGELAKVYLSSGDKLNAEISYEKLLNSSEIPNLFREYTRSLNEIKDYIASNSDDHLNYAGVERAQKAMEFLSEMTSMNEAAIANLEHGMRHVCWYFYRLESSNIKEIHSPNIYIFINSIREILIPRVFKGYPNLESAALHGVDIYLNKLSKNIDEWNELFTD